MAEIRPQDVKEITRDGGIRSRKLWAFAILLAVSFPLIWYGKISSEHIALLLGLFLIYCGGNVAAKHVLTGGKLWGLLTSTKKADKE